MIAILILSCILQFIFLLSRSSSSIYIMTQFTFRGYVATNPDTQGGHHVYDSCRNGRPFPTGGPLPARGVDIASRSPQRRTQRARRRLRQAGLKEVPTWCILEVKAMLGEPGDAQSPGQQQRKRKRKPSPHSNNSNCASLATNEIPRRSRCWALGL